MIAFKVGDEYIDLYPDVQVQFVMNNPIFAEGGFIEGTYSIPFEAPLTPKNLSILGQPHIWRNNDVTPKSVDAIFLVDGAPMLRGKLKYQESEKPRYSLNFVSGLATVSETFKEKKLREVMDEAITVIASPRVYVALDYVGPASGDLQLSINGDEYTTPYTGSAATSMSNLAGVIDGDGKYSAAINGGTGYLEIEPLDNTDVFAEFSVSSSNPSHWDVKEDYLEQYQEDFMTYVDTYAADPQPNNKLRFPPVMNPYFYEQAPAYGIINACVGNNFADIGGLRTLNGYPDASYPILPFVRLGYILDQIATDQGIVFEGEFIDDADMQEVLIYMPNSMDFEKQHLWGNWVVHGKDTFNIADHVPDWTLGEFFKALQSTFNISIIYDGQYKKMRLDFRENIITSTTYRDITPKCSPIRDFELSHVTGLTFSPTEDENDVTYSDTQGLVNFDYADDNNPRKAYTLATGAGTIENKLAGISDYLLPWGTIDVLLGILQAKDEEKGLPRAVFYRGIHTYDASNEYPYASLKTANYSLSWYGTLGLYEVLWKNWAHFRTHRKTAKVDAVLDVEDILNLDWREKVRYDGVNCLVKQLKVTFTMRGVKVSELELYKCA